MRDRHKRNKGDEKHKIAIAFNNSTKGDQQCIKSQKRKEEYECIYGKPYPEWNRGIITDKISPLTIT